MTFVVSNTNNSGVGTLRQAVLDANAGGGGDVSFSSFFNAPQTISLSSGQITITSNITIVGPGANKLTIRNTQVQHPTSRVFKINDGIVAALSGMTISGGNTDDIAGGIWNGASTLTIDECAVASNGTVGAGGGVENSAGGTLTILNSTISNNAAGASFGGGGIDNWGTIFLTNSTVSNNFIGGTSGTNAGGIWTNGQTTISASTITGNVSAGPFGSAGGLYSAGGGTVTVRNTIIAVNGFHPDITAPSSPIISAGFNLIGDRRNADAFTQVGDQVPPTNTPIDPGLGILADNGGPTRTHALLPNSPAINKGKSFGIVRDQRGVFRPIGPPATAGSDGSDIGAFETQNTVRSDFDFDGDGKTDASIFRPNGATGSEWWYLKSSNGGNFATQFGSPTDKLVAADYTGDGKADIAFWRPSTGEWFILRSEDSSFYAFPFGAAGDVPAPADYDGDGKADAAVFRPSNSTWFIQNSGGGTTIQAFGAAGDVPVVGDYDGDGKADLAIFRPNGATGSEWWYLKSSNGGNFATQFGTPTDKTVPGDYTGDGKTDIAFWRPATGQWYILRSEDLSFFAFPFGSNGDIPVPGDYDGDGKTDAAVFRPSSSTWFAQGSTSGTIIQQFGAAGDIPVPSEFVR